MVRVGSGPPNGTSRTVGTVVARWLTGCSGCTIFNARMTHQKTLSTAFWTYLLVAAMACGVFAGEDKSADPKKITLRAWGVASAGSGSIDSQAIRKAMQAFQAKYPHVTPVSTTGLKMAGGVNTMDLIPLMQIAGDIAPDVLYVNFRKSETYLSQKFLYPMDRFIEESCWGEQWDPENPRYIQDTHLMGIDEYLEAVKKLPLYEHVLGDRVVRQCWDVIRRKCPYGTDCPYCKEWGVEATEKHRHIWCFPEGPLVMASSYRKDLFAESALPDRVPADWQELLDWSRKLTNPADDRYGLYIGLTEIGWSTLSFLYSTGGLIVEQEEDDTWRCVFDSDEAVEAYYFVARLFLEPFENEYGEFDSVVYTGDSATKELKKIAMEFTYLDERFFGDRDVNRYGFGPVPKSMPTESHPEGMRGSEFNSRMAGIYAGIEDEETRLAAWHYILFFDGTEARKLRTDVFVEEGLGQYMRPQLLIDAGYPEYVRQVPEGWEEAYQTAMAGGVPEPYGTNCDMAYSYVNNAVDQIRTDKKVQEFIRAGAELTLRHQVESGEITEEQAIEIAQEYQQKAKNRIRDILTVQVGIGNEKMLSLLTEDTQKFRNRVATAVALGILVLFVFVFRWVFRIFDAQQAQVPGEEQGRWEFFRYKWAYILLIPAVGSIALWAYYPVIRGTFMAFEDYNVRGFSKWVGIQNFANVLWDTQFWFSIWITIKYALLYAFFGFAAPIILAFLLTEVPKGKVLFRTIYYLPAVLTGVVTLLLWKGFYSEYGMINTVLNYVIQFINFFLPAGGELVEVHKRWLDEPSYALFFCLLPTIWAGMGPGCLIYLAALKTVPDDLYEAADIDGAGIWYKIVNVAIPGIKGLIMINFIGMMVGLMKSGGANMLAMTGGGPNTPYGQTRVAGLHIFYEAFGYLRFGTAVSMAWILGAMLIGFTVIQMQKLSKMEFKTAKGV